MKNKSADGLRGLAALSVTLTHFIAAFLPWLLFHNYGELFPRHEGGGTAAEFFGSPLMTLFYNGHFAVLIFFVLSGYVLTLPYFSRTNAVDALQRRLWARYLRLNLPIIAAIGLAYLAYRFGLMHNDAAALLSGSVKWLGSFYPPGLNGVGAIHEATFGAIVLGSASFLPPLWTLKVEFIGSLYILLFYLAKPTGRIWTPMLLASALLYAIHGADSIYYYAIFAGSALHCLSVKGKTAYVLLAVGLYLGAYQHFRVMYGFLPNPMVWDIKTTYNLIGAICLCAAVLSGTGRDILASRPVQFLGRISFSIYLLHFIVLCSLSSWLYVRLPRDASFIAVQLLVYVGACIGAACIFERYIDRPAINLSRRFTAFISSDIVHRVPEPDKTTVDDLTTGKRHNTPAGK